MPSCQIAVILLFLFFARVSGEGYGFTSGPIGTRVTLDAAGSVAIGDTVNFTWATGTFEKKVDLVLEALFSNAGDLLLAAGIDNTGSFVWKVPQNLSDGYF